uniref:RING-type domain-containing protein n=1 Tax=Salvator merianae TaxID=96440 RepID=A0A8D0DT77_SALMN
MKDILCPICKEPMRNPVSVNCGHNFCENCIDQYFEKWSEVAKMLCPVCRVRNKKESIRLNWQLKSLVDKVILQTTRGCLSAEHPSAPAKSTYQWP